MGNTFPGGAGYVFKCDASNSRPDRQNDLLNIWYPNEVAPFIDSATRTVNVAAVYATATPRYTIQYGQIPTDPDTYGRVIKETVGASGVGGTYYYAYFTSDLPDNLIDPGDPIVFRCAVTDRNGNQTLYDFNAAQMPVHVDVVRSPGKISIPPIALPPTGFLGYETWTAYNINNQPMLQVVPEGNSVASFYEDGTGTGASALYNRRVGLLIRRTAYPDNAIGIVSRPGSSGQSQLTETFFYEPIFNQICARVERRGNPIDDSGDYFPPQNAGSGSPVVRYSTITIYDYQKDAQATVAGDGNLQTQLALSSGQINSLYAFVNGPLSTAGLTGLPCGLGDVNGDRTAAGPRPTRPIWATS